MEQELNEVSELLQKIEGLRVKKLISPEERPDRLLGNNGTLLLLRLLERSRDQLMDCLAAYKGKRILSLFIQVRAHFETTASLMYFFGKLTKFYGGEIDLTQMEEALSKLSVGAKLKPEFNSEYPVPDPINVLTTIKHTDTLLRESGSTIDMFAGAYNFICEIAHPNHLGLLYRSEVSVKTGTVAFLSDEEAFDKNCKSPLYKLLISANVFLHWYGKAFSMLEKNETMPTLIK